MLFYTYSVTGPKIVKEALPDAMTATWVNLAALIVLMLIQPIGGLVSDVVGRKPVCIFFAVGGMAYTYPLVTYLPSCDSAILSFAMLSFSFVILTGYTSITALIKAELFPSHIRALGVGIGHAIANTAVGGTAPMFFQWAQTNDFVPWFIAYAIFVTGISLFVYVVFLRNKSETYLDREQGHAFV